MRTHCRSGNRSSKHTVGTASSSAPLRNSSHATLYSVDLRHIGWRLQLAARTMNQQADLPIGVAPAAPSKHSRVRRPTRSGHSP